MVTEMEVVVLSITKAEKSDDSVNESYKHTSVTYTYMYLRSCWNIRVADAFLPKYFA